MTNVKVVTDADEVCRPCSTHTSAMNVALRRCVERKIIDTPAEEAFDRFTRLVTLLLGFPFLVTFVHHERGFFKSATGIDAEAGQARGVPLSHSLCRLVVESREQLIVDDARGDLRVCDNPAGSDLGVAAYAGAPSSAPTERCSAASAR